MYQGVTIQAWPQAGSGSALEALVDAAAGILAADSLQGTLGRIAHHLDTLLSYDDLTVYEIDEEAAVLRPVFAVGNWVDEILSSVIPLAALLRADEMALMRVDRATGTLILLTDHPVYGRDASWPLADFPATEHVLRHRVSGQVIVGDPQGDPAEIAALIEEGFATMLMVPVVCGDRVHAVLEVYRVLPRAFSGAEIDRARVVAQQFGAALDRL
jgi:GAF domain-containing protein